MTTHIGRFLGTISVVSRFRHVDTDERNETTMAEDQVLRVLSDFARTLVAKYAVSDALHGLVENVGDLLGIAGAGVSLVDPDAYQNDGDGTLRFATALNETTATIESVQQARQKGPCVDAHRGGVPVFVTDLRDNPDRWPDLTKVALEVGVVAAAGIPMRLDGYRVGALNLYAAETREWPAEDLSLAQVLADMATAYVINASELDQSARTVEQLQEALDSRVVIEQAKGILAAESGSSMDEAFERIRGHARNNNISARSAASGIVELGLRP